MPWARKSGAFDLCRLVGKAFDEGMADAAALFLRIGDAGQCGEKFVFGLDHVQVGLEVVGEFLDDRFFLVLAQQAVIDQDAGELRADGLRQQGGGHRRIDSAGESANHAIIAHAPADGLDGFAGEIAQLPVACDSRRRSSGNCPGFYRPAGVCVTSG